MDIDERACCPERSDDETIASHLTPTGMNNVIGGRGRPFFRNVEVAGDVQEQRGCPRAIRATDELDQQANPEAFSSESPQLII